MPPARIVRLLAALALAAAVAACGGAAATPAPPAGSTGIVREDLGSSLPGNAPGQRLTLWHYIIPAGSKLAPHDHPGWQIARIAAGTLTYTVLTGSVNVQRANGALESHPAGQTIKLETGDSVLENPDEDHEAENAGTVAVELWATSLLADGADVAVPVPTQAP
ncbi:MAG: cupin domain-containing protein [Chloroflexota bacterium]